MSENLRNAIVKTARRISSHTMRSMRGMTRSRRCGLTLLELLVVLVILAIVSTITVNSLQPNIDATRFDQTRNILENVRSAVQGNTNGQQADGTPLINGFVADIGRLPRPRMTLSRGDNNVQQTDELYSTNCDLAVNFPFQFRSGPRQPVDYSEVRLPCGWRGPYLRMAGDLTEVTDAWGRPLQYGLNQESQIDSVVWAARPPYDQPLDVRLDGSLVTVAGTVNSGKPDSSDLQIVLLVPNPDSSLTNLQVLDDEDSAARAFSFARVPVGLRAICVRHGDSAMVKYIQVPYGGLSLIIDLDEQTRQD
jgi:prepilin-type N-terminal cleavage/methylation domain-containing protein